MTSASVADIRKQLKSMDRDELSELCLRLIRFKKENKELLSYVLFDADNERDFIREFKEEMDQMFAEMNTSHVYLAKKTIRKMLRLINKYVRFSGSRIMEIELLVHFCSLFRHSSLPVESHSTLYTIYTRQLDKIKKALSTLHEDVQYDYRDILVSLELL